MNIKIDNMEEILNDRIRGFHIYSFEKEPRVIFAGRDLQKLLGASEKELTAKDEDGYLNFIHPEDRIGYLKELEKISNTEGKFSLQYRLTAKDGNILHVCDEIVITKKDGAFEGCSVLCDITKLTEERSTLRLLNDTLPCGFLKYTCERHPKVTYANKKMLEIMKFPEVKEGEIDCFDLYKENIYLMIPLEERRYLAYCLDKIGLDDAPVAGEITVLRCDGKKARLFGWIAKHINEKGEEEFISVCMDITERYRRNKEKETANYIRALTDVYDKIFQYDYSGNTVKCLHWQNADNFKWMMEVPMQMEDATEKWIDTTVYEEDRQKLREYFREFHDENLIKSELKPRTISYREMTGEGKLCPHTGIFLKIDSTTALFCCKTSQNDQEADSLRNENESLKNMQKMVMKFSDGISAFEVRDKMVTPLYVSDNVLEFFGFSKEEWMPMMKKAVSIRKLVSRCEVDYSEFMKLLQQGEAEYTYYDVNRKRERHIKAITSEKNPGSTAPFYVMLYNLDDKPQEEKKAEISPSKVEIRTFGYFDVFADGKPIAFRNEKSKELLALLTDRRGGFVTSEEAINFLWEDSPVDSAALARYRKVALKLKNSLEEYGIDHIIESVNGKRRLVTERVSCDLYDFLTGKEEYKLLFKGSYLTNYSWGETTLAELLQSTL